MELRCVFDNDHALVFGNGCGKGPQNCGLSCGGSATDEERLSAANLGGKKLRKRSRKRAASDKVIDRVMPAGELAKCKCRSRTYNRRNDRRQTTSVRELRVQEWVVFIEAFAELI